MSDYIEDALPRTNLQQIRSYMLYGEENSGNYKKGNYQERLTTGREAIDSHFRSIFSNMKFVG